MLSLSVKDFLKIGQHLTNLPAIDSIVAPFFDSQYIPKGCGQVTLPISAFRK